MNTCNPTPGRKKKVYIDEINKTTFFDAEKEVTVPDFITTDARISMPSSVI